LGEFIDIYGGNILDYGCGTAVHWTKRVVDGKSLTEILGDKLVGFRRYDPYHEPFSSKPTGKYDIVICSDVMEHVPIDDVSGVLRDINGYINKGLALFTISTKPSKNSFISGENIHITLLPKDEWIKILDNNLSCHFKVIFDDNHEYYSQKEEVLPEIMKQNVFDKRIIIVICEDGQDFYRWLKTNKSSSGTYSTSRKFICENTTYYAVSRPEHLCSISCDEIVEAENARDNDKYIEIILQSKYCLKPVTNKID